MAHYGSVDAVRRRLRSFFALGTAGLWGGDSTVDQDARIVGYLEDATQEITARLAGRLRITDPGPCGITLCAVLIACYQIIMDEFTGKAPVPGDGQAVNAWREQAERILTDLSSLSDHEVVAAEGIELARSREVFPISVATEPRVEWP